MKIIQHSQIIESVSYEREFRYIDCPGAGTGFPSDEEGNVDVEALNPAAAENFERSLRLVETGEMRDLGVVKYEHAYREAAIGRCVCGNEVILDGFTCTCERCHRDYNSAGQELAPRSQWGEETGETAADILNLSGLDW